MRSGCVRKARRDGLASTMQACSSFAPIDNEGEQSFVDSITSSRPVKTKEVSELIKRKEKISIHREPLLCEDTRSQTW